MSEAVDSKRYVRGDKHHLARLTDAKVREMRRQFDAKLKTITAIAHEFGVSFWTADRACKRVTWKHIVDPAPIVDPAVEPPVA